MLGSYLYELILRAVESPVDAISAKDPEYDLAASYVRPIFCAIDNQLIPNVTNRVDLDNRDAEPVSRNLRFMELFFMHSIVNEPPEIGTVSIG
jgi:hypothetical protein